MAEAESVSVFVCLEGQPRIVEEIEVPYNSTVEDCLKEAVRVIQVRSPHVYRMLLPPLKFPNNLSQAERDELNKLQLVPSELLTTFLNPFAGFTKPYQPGATTTYPLLLVPMYYGQSVDCLKDYIQWKPTEEMSAKILQIFNKNQDIVETDVSTILEPHENNKGEALFLSGYDTHSHARNIVKYNIKRVLNVGGRSAGARCYVLPQNVEYAEFDILDVDHCPIITYFQDAFKFIRDGVDGKSGYSRTLIHCHAGVSRSVTTMIAYLVAEHNMRLPDAALHVVKRRPCAWPNDGFIDQLIMFAASLDRL